jgi:hypothetical protein
MLMKSLHEDLNLTLNGDLATESQHGDRPLSWEDWGIAMFDRVSDIKIDGALCDSVKWKSWVHCGIDRVSFDE